MSKSIAPELPFECMVSDKSETLTNPFSGVSVECPPDFVAVYDTIKGAEMLENYDTMEKGIDWARKFYPDLYMKLLD